MTTVVARAPGYRWVHGSTLKNVARCPHCGIANPLLSQRWRSECVTPEGKHYGRIWAAYECSSCRGHVLARGIEGNQGTTGIDELYPSVKTAPNFLPATAEHFLNQAYESLSSPDGAVMLANASVDAMLKEKNLIEGSIYKRIDEAVAGGILTKDMGEWAHKVRLDSNRPRHSDVGNPHVSKAEAEQAVEFVYTLGYVLFTLPAIIQNGKSGQEP